MFSEVLVVFLGVFTGAKCLPEQGQCISHMQEMGAVKVALTEPIDYNSTFSICKEDPLTPLYSFLKLNEDERWLCGDQLVPFQLLVYYEDWENMRDRFDGDLPNKADLQLMDLPDEAMAVNPTTGRWRYVDETYMFSCLLCQNNAVMFPKSVYFRFEDMTTSTYFVVRLASADIRETAEVSEETKATLHQQLYEILEPLNYLEWSVIEFRRSWLDETHHLQIEYHVDSPIAASVATGGVQTSIMNDSYFMRVEDVSFCPSVETVDVDGVVTFWQKGEIEDMYYFNTNSKTGSILHRECLFNETIFQGQWDERTSRWELVWKNCSSSDELYNNEEDYKQFLDADDIERRHGNVLQEFNSESVNTTKFMEIARLVDREIVGRNELYDQTMRYLVNITSNLELDSDHFVAIESRTYLIVADLKGSDSPVGFTLDIEGSNITFSDNITLNRKATLLGRAPFAIDVSARLTEAHTRMAFIAFWKNIPIGYGLHMKARRFQNLEVTVMFPKRDEVSAWTFASYGNHHVDITYDVKKLEFDRSINFFNCIVWNNALQDWSSVGCVELYSDRNNMRACRCSAKYFVLKDGVPMAKFSLRKGLVGNEVAARNNPFTDFLKDKPGLMAATAIECLLSALGLGSIICTAARFKHWRENTGHKILLHMIFALTCNLVLGFTVNFVHMNTESVGCLVYGVLRHYSFLAMFLWMLVLSCLQLKRLLTVAGAKATSHLILKVSVFAWGVPLLPITTLLALSPGFYQTDRFDRGYCYPEGIVFQVTVQGPAGVILLVNLAIFIKIVTHIFECFSEEKITRHSKNQRAEQLNKLKTSLFIFFLFGFSWVFHFLSEERVIISDFLFEYLFLMTATTHIFFLALFFVVFQSTTRKEWVSVISKAASDFQASFSIKAKP